MINFLEEALKKLNTVDLDAGHVAVAQVYALLLIAQALQGLADETINVRIEA